MIPLLTHSGRHPTKFFGLTQTYKSPSPEFLRYHVSLSDLPSTRVDHHLAHIRSSSRHINKR